MIKILPLLAALLLAPMAAHADDEQLLVAAEAFGGLSGSLCFDIYTALSDLKGAATSGPKGLIASSQVERHVKVIGILKKHTAKMRASIKDDETFTEVCDKLDATALALKEQAESLDAYLQSHSPADLKKATARKEAARVRVLTLLHMSEDTGRAYVP
jgi:hypothetical protein